MNSAGEPIHRPSDRELVGYVSSLADGRWQARAIFGGALETFAERAAAVDYLRRHGLAVLAQRWWFWSADQHEWVPVALVEASLDEVRVRSEFDPAAPLIMLRDAELENLARRPETKAGPLP